MIDAVHVVVVARNSIVREGLSRILSEKNFKVVEAVSSAQKINAQSDDLGPIQIIIADCSSDDGDGPDLAEIKRHLPRARTILLADTFDFNTMLSALRDGAWGLVVSDISCESLIGAINLVAMGEKVLPSQLADNLPSYLPQVERGCTEATLRRMRLNAQEVDILRCLAMGYPNKVVSRFLDISEIRVKAHVKTVLRKISVRNRTQAAIWAANNGLTALECPPAMMPQMAAAAGSAMGPVPMTTAPSFDSARIAVA
jgi:two-component system, NarL family, nitrate/nitrite response regulator NarL